MKIGPLHSPSTFALDPSAATQGTKAKAQAGQVDGAGAIDPEKLRLAREFEQIFIRKMLSPLEKSGHNQSGPSASAGGDAYGSMVVSALAEAVSKGGGVGLAEVIARAASQPGGIVPTLGTASTTATQAASANTTAATTSSSAATLGSGAARVTVPQNVRITVSHPPGTATYTRPAPTPIINENKDIHDLFKDPKR